MWLNGRWQPISPKKAWLNMIHGWKKLWPFEIEIWHHQYGNGTHTNSAVQLHFMVWCTTLAHTLIVMLPNYNILGTPFQTTKLHAHLPNTLTTPLLTYFSNFTISLHISKRSIYFFPFDLAWNGEMQDNCRFYVFMTYSSPFSYNSNEPSSMQIGQELTELCLKQKPKKYGLKQLESSWNTQKPFSSRWIFC